MDLAALDGAIHHVHAKDTRIEDRAAVAARLEVTPNERVDERAWNYVAVGAGHPDGVAFWTRFVTAPRAAGCRSRTRTTLWVNVNRSPWPSARSVAATQPIC